MEPSLRVCHGETVSSCPYSLTQSWHDGFGRAETCRTLLPAQKWAGQSAALAHEDLAISYTTFSVGLP